jgi:hypothetical protein
MRAAGVVQPDGVGKDLEGGKFRKPGRVFRINGIDPPGRMLYPGGMRGLDILEEDEVALEWRKREMQAGLSSVVRMFAVAGPLFALLAILILLAFGNDEVSLEFSVFLVLLMPALGGIMWLGAARSWKSRNRWELSERGIKVTGALVTSFRWSRIEVLSFRDIDGLPAHTRVFIQRKPYLWIFRLASFEIIVKASEEELRRLLVENRG